MEALCSKLEAANVKLSFEENAVVAKPHGELNAVDIRTVPNPGFRANGPVLWKKLFLKIALCMYLNWCVWVRIFV